MSKNQNLRDSPFNNILIIRLLLQETDCIAVILFLREALTEHTNSKLIYEYTESYLKYIDKGLDSIKEKATTLLAFSPIVLKFSAELASSNSWLTITKVGTCILILVNIIICIVILNPSKEGDVVKPSELIYDWFYKEEDSIRLFISRQWIEACKQLDDDYNKRAKLLTHCYSSIGVASILFTLNIIFNTICTGN